MIHTIYHESKSLYRLINTSAILITHYLCQQHKQTDIQASSVCLSFCLSDTSTAVCYTFCVNNLSTLTTMDHFSIICLCICPFLSVTIPPSSVISSLSACLAGDTCAAWNIPVNVEKNHSKRCYLYLVSTNMMMMDTNQPKIRMAYYNTAD